MREDTTMTFENFENIISLLCTIAGLLYCVFKYTETPERGYRYIIIFFLAHFLSEYYWTVYELVMHSYPDVSAFTAYLGWNIAIVFLHLAVIHLRQEEAKHFFHPLMLLPVFTNLFQFLLYIRYGGLLNNLWQVGITTFTMVYCLQDLLCYRKLRPRKFPWLSFLILSYLISQYGMWTASCFDWSSELLNPYLYFTILGSFISIFLAFGVEKYYAKGYSTKLKSASEMRFQVLAQTVASLIILVICAAGFLIAFYIKNSLTDVYGNVQNEEKLLACLFAISLILILLVLVFLFFLTSRYRHLITNSRLMNEMKRIQLNFYVTIAVTLALMASAVIYTNILLYNSSVISVYESAEEEIKTTATDLESYLTVAMTTLRVAADSVDLMEKSGNSPQEIENYIVNQTERQSRQFDENFTGIYAYINGQYLDGLGWVPPDDYDAVSRDWYKTTVQANGNIVIVSPYVDAQTGSIVITIGKSISDYGHPADSPQKNVVCLDVMLNYIQNITEEIEIAGKGYGMVINSDGFIIAHRDSSLNGQNLNDIYGSELLQQILHTDSGRTSTMIGDEECTLFIAPVMDQWYSLIIIRNSELFEETYSQLAVTIMVSFITFCLISFFYYIGYKNEQIYGRKVEELNIQVVSALASAIDAKDNYTNGHSARVAEYARTLAARAGFSKQEQDEIYMMGLLHDVGKIGVPDSVINKPSPLTEEEYALVKKHPEIGYGILETIKERPKLSIGARWHHERYDGSGYPDGISGEQIPTEVRIIAVADAYDAMTSRRRYRDIMPQKEVREEFQKGMGTQFDPRFAKIMLQMIDEDTEYHMREK